MARYILYHNCPRLQYANSVLPANQPSLKFGHMRQLHTLADFRQTTQLSHTTSFCQSYYFFVQTSVSGKRLDLRLALLLLANCVECLLPLLSCCVAEARPVC